MRRHLAILTAALATALASAGTAGATTFYLSTLGGPVLPALPGSRGGDIVQYDDSSGTASVFFNEDIFNTPGSGPEVDAFELLPNGHMLFSTFAASNLGSPFPPGLAFVDGDIIEYDPVTFLATKIFDEQQNFSGQADIDAVAALPNGHILFSTSEDENGLAGAPNIRDGDIIEWNPLTNTFVGLYIQESLFGLDDIDAFDVTDDGKWALSTTANASIGSVNFTGSDLVLYDPGTLSAVIWIPASAFGDPLNSPLDAIAVPEPSTSALLALGILGLAFVGTRRQR